LGKDLVFSKPEGRRGKRKGPPSFTGRKEKKPAVCRTTSKVQKKGKRGKMLPEILIRENFRSSERKKR